MIRHLASTLLILSLSPTTFAQDDAGELRKIPVAKRSGTATRIVYGSATWNSEPTKIDSAFLFLRDRKTGRIAKVILDESQPDSSTFSGAFSLNWGNMEKTRPYVYIPPQNLRGAEGLKKFKEMLVSGKISNKPVVFRKTEGGGMALDVYDTQEQAQKAYSLMRKQVELEKRGQRAKDLLEKAKTDESVLDSEKLAEEEKKKKLAEIAANKQEAERIRMEQIEQQKEMERMKMMASMAAAEKARRAQQAAALAKDAMAFFMKNDFGKASELFQQAVEINPENKDYYMNYGIAQYRLKKYNEALVMFDLVPETSPRNLEKRYYQGLAYFNLKDYSKATPHFEFVKTQNDKNMSPSAAFYLGLIQMTQKKWELAKENFQHVLDTSSDPAMDNQAEAYIESISAQQAWDRKKEKPFTLTAMLGAMYDSNVLLTPDGDSGSGTAIEGDMRGTLMGLLQYRALYEKNHEWTPTFMTFYQRSSKDVVSTADPFLNNLSAPYKLKGTAWGKGHTFTFKPAGEVLNLDANNDGTREIVQNSYLANFDNTFVMSKKWIASYIFEARMDDSQLPSSTGDANADAMKYTLKTKHISFLNEKRKKILMSYIGLVLNAAEGKDKVYQRIEAGATFIKPLNWWESTWTFGLSMYQQKYPDASTKRTDLNTAVNTSISRPINEWLNFSLALGYTNNGSDVSSNQYNKYSVTTNLISKTNF